MFCRVTHDIEGTDQFEEFFGGLSAEDQARVDKAIGYLGEFGYSLGRPHADTVGGSRHANMKELRPSGSTVRIFFASAATSAETRSLSAHDSDRGRFI
jgi:hypothetical protein